MVKIGDIFDIPLSNGRRAYGQLVFKDKQFGPLIQVFDLISSTQINDVQQLENLKPLFPPVITGVNAMTRAGKWTVIGHSSVENFIYPKFVRTFYDENSGEACIWFIWDGEKETRLGKILPDEYKKLEYLVVWSPFDVVARIETGEYPFPYGDLIAKNQFKPKRQEKIDKKSRPW